MTINPTNKKLYDQVKKEADAKFLAPTSVYKSAWIIREYKKKMAPLKIQNPKITPLDLRDGFVKNGWI
jgi:hypothetical protein